MPVKFVHTGRLLGRGVPILNRAHPLAQGLVGAYVPAMAPAGTVINLASPGIGDLTSRTGVPVGLSATPEGSGVAYSGTALAQINGATPASWQKASGQSLFVRFRRNGTAYIGGKPAYLLGVGINGSPFNAFAVGAGMSGSSGAGQLGLFYQTASGNYIGSIIPALNTMASAGATFGAGAPGKLYVNGVQDTVGNSPPNVNITTYTAPVTTYLGQQSSGDAVGATITVGYIWNRVLTPGEMRYLDANPYALLLWPSDRVSLALATLAGSDTAVRADAILAAEFLESLLNDSGVLEESLAGGSAITGNATLPLEFSANVLRDWGAGAARSMIRRFSHPALAGRFRRLLFPGRRGTLAIESEGRQHADPGAPIESLGSAGNSVAGDAMSPIEALSSQRSEQGAEIENTASLQVDRGAPVEALAGGITTITDANLAIEWVRAAPSILVSLESGPERVRLLATRGRVRLLRRK